MSNDVRVLGPSPVGTGPRALVARGREDREWLLVWHRLRQHRLAMGGLVVLLALILLSLLAPLLTPYNHERIDLLSRFQPPSRAHWMGTDELGRDVFTRILFGGRISLSVGFIVAISGTLLGGVIGVVSGYAGGRTDEIIMRLVDVIRSLPIFPILIVLSVILRQRLAITGGLWNIVIILILFSWTGIARIVRGVVLSLKEQEFIMAAQVVGVPRRRILFVHLFANALSPMIVSATLGAGIAISAESALSFLGLGIQPPTPSWGNMLFNAQSYLWNEPWIAIFPGFFIFITLLSFNFLGDGLRDALDPRLRT